MKQLSTSLSLVFALGGSSAALAMGPQCEVVCSCESSCDTVCYDYWWKSTCGEGAYGTCVDYCRASDPQASLTSKVQEQQKALEQHDAARDVCTEQAQRATSSKS